LLGFGIKGCVETHGNQSRPVSSLVDGKEPVMSSTGDIASKPAGRAISE